mgnify:CR=1 FL=1
MKGYILNLNTKKRIEFKDSTNQIVMLNDVREVKIANYFTEQTLGRSEDYMVFSHSSSTEITFHLGFWFNEPEKTKEIKDKFKSLLYPIKKGNIPIPPPPILLVWGNLYNVRGVVKSFQAVPNDRYNLSKQLPYGIDIFLEIVEVNIQPKYHGDLWKVEKK